MVNIMTTKLEMVVSKIEADQKQAKQDIQAFENKIAELEQKKRRLEEGKRSLFEKYVDTNELVIGIAQYKDGLEKAKEVLEEVNEQIGDEIYSGLAETLRSFSPKSKLLEEIEGETNKYIKFIEKRFDKLFEDNRNSAKKQTEMINTISKLEHEEVSRTIRFATTPHFSTGEMLLHEVKKVEQTVRQLAFAKQNK